MGRVASCLQMLFILQSRNGGLVKLSELAERLEVGERMIRSYREDLEMAGIRVDSITGKNGGYSIPPGRYMKLPPLTEMERLALTEGLSQLFASDTFVLRQDLQNGIEKILSDQPPLEQPAGKLYIQEDQSASQTGGSRNIYLDFNAAVIEKRKLRILYYSNANEVTERVLRPYGLVAYKNAWYCIAYCELRGEIRAFKLARVQRYDGLAEHFTIPEDFNIKEHVGDFHLMKGKKIRLELRVKAPLANHVSERVWGEEQKLERLADGSILLAVDVEDSPELTGWILSLGKSACVISPEQVRSRLRREIEWMALEC